MQTQDRKNVCSKKDNAQQKYFSVEMLWKVNLAIVHFYSIQRDSGREKVYFYLNLQANLKLKIMLCFIDFFQHNDHALCVSLRLPGLTHTQQWDTTSTYRHIPPSSISSIFTFPFMMANFMCQLGWPLCPAMWLNIILDVSVRVFLNEIKHLNQWILLSMMWVDLIQSVEGLKRLTSLKPEDRGSLFSRHTLPPRIEKYRGTTEVLIVQKI